MQVASEGHIAEGGKPLGALDRVRVEAEGFGEHQHAGTLGGGFEQELAEQRAAQSGRRAGYEHAVFSGTGLVHCPPRSPSNSPRARGCRREIQSASQGWA